MISTLIKTLTASNDASLSFVDGTSDVVFDSTYDAYMFVCTDINPSSAGTGPHFQFQVNEVGGSGYNELVTGQVFNAFHNPGDTDAQLDYQAGYDQAQGTGLVTLAIGVGGESDESTSGILHIFSPANTTFVTHYKSRFNGHRNDDYSHEVWSGGYFNTTTGGVSATGPIAIDEIQFKFSDGGNFDGVIQMYGIS